MMTLNTVWEAWGWIATYLLFAILDITIIKLNWKEVNMFAKIREYGVSFPFIVMLVLIMHVQLGITSFFVYNNGPLSTGYPHGNWNVHWMDLLFLMTIPFVFLLSMIVMWIMRLYNVSVFMLCVILFQEPSIAVFIGLPSKKISIVPPILMVITVVITSCFLYLHFYISNKTPNIIFEDNWCQGTSSKKTRNCSSCKKKRNVKKAD